MVGVEPVDDLRGAIVLRYRDGQPFTRIVVAELSQGATAVMGVPRGEPVPRHTFHMTLDARLQYRLAVGDVRGALILDGFNLLGSGTEVLEDPRTGDSFRQSLEMVPGRSVIAGLEMSW